jgi:putative DNA methylase
VITHSVKSPRKLIEVALPLDAINIASGREKSIRQGHPSTLHLWWARRPLAAARAVIFGQLVNDPGYQQGGGFKYGKNKKEAAVERKRLFKIIEDLVLWENTNNEIVLEAARAEIRRSWQDVCALNKDHPQAGELFNPEKLPALHDPFAGGGAIPLEAQRLGFEAFASDLNPVAVLINKAMIEIPPKFAGRIPVGPLPADDSGAALDLPKIWPNASGLAEDVHRYGAWIRSEAQKRIGDIYPPVEITSEMARERPDLGALVGQKLPVIAWLWARTVKSPNPAFSHVDVPLVSSFIISSKEGKEAYIEPVVKGEQYRFTVKMGSPPSRSEEGTKATGRGASFICLVSNTAISGDYIKAEAQAGRMGQRLLAIVAEGSRSRVYLAPSAEAEMKGRNVEPTWRPDLEFFQQALGFRVGNYGMAKWSDLFTPRQLVTLTTFCDLVCEVKERIYRDALSYGMADDQRGLNADGMGAIAYAEAVSTYLALAVGKLADYNSSLCSWISGGQTMRNTFGRQAVPMVWDFAEANALGVSTGSYASAIDQGVRVIRDGLPATCQGHASQCDAQTQNISLNKIISTDPPYYDNIGYADLSDFFYVWMRRCLRPIFPDLLATMAVPKEEELVATPARHGGKEKAEAFFLDGMTRAMRRLVDQAHPAVPVTIYYAFKQSDTQTNSGTSSTGWETFLEAVNRAGLQLSGTWPMRTELGNRMRSSESNALASSIVLVCRKRPIDAATISRREFLRELNAVLPEALDEMTKGSGDDRSPVAPVDLSQAIIGPGIAVFSKYAAVLEADGSPMGVRTALQLINRFLAEDDFDPDTQFCMHWFEQHAWNEGAYGDADTLSRGKGTSVDGMKVAGILHSGGGKVRLLKWAEYPSDWDPKADTRLPVWEALHQLIRALKQGGESASGVLLAALGGKAEAVRQLAYRLYTLCERLGLAEDARAYNEFITSWTGIESAASVVPFEEPQGNLFN